MSSLFRLALLSSVGVLALGGAAEAGPITWTFQGTLGNTSQTAPAFPDGTAVRVDWTFDSAATNLCQPAGGTGVYGGQTLTVHVGSTLGPLTYQGTNGTLISGGILPLGCATATAAPSFASDMELRIPTWTGPSLAGLTLDPTGGVSPPGFFWLDPTLGGAFPSSPPPSLFFMMPTFYPAGSFGAVNLSGTLQPVPVPVPEPSALLLLGTGLVGLVVRRRMTRRA